MTPTVFLILILTYTTYAGLIPGLDVFTYSTNSSTDGANSGIKGVIEVIPETITDVVEDTFDVNNMPVVPWVPVPELIKNEGYPSESHYVTTEDGYILNIHRIPHGKNNNRNGKVIYLQHGLLCASSDWVLLGPRHGLGYILADAGYDVWMGNIRGNLYSRNHTSLSPDDKEFWQFSFHEIGIIDIPCIIDYILEKTNSPNLFHIGHSQGTTTFYVMTSEKPEYNNKVEAHIALAPVAFMNHAISPLLRILALGTIPIDILLEMIGQYEFAPNSGFLNILSDVACSVGVGKVLCKNAIFAICGFSPNQMNESNIPLIMAHYPAGAATKQVIHYSQEVNSGNFEQFDYYLNNYNHYNSFSPPDYKLERISCPIHFIYGSNDWLAANCDVERLYARLSSGKELYNIPIQTWNHVDFQFGNDAPTIVYEKILQILSIYH